MSDVEPRLAPGELVLYRTGLHWILYAGAFGPTGVAIGGAVASSLMPDGLLRWTLLLTATLALAGGLLQLLASWAQIRKTEILVTDRRVIYASGVLARRSVEMSRDKLDTVLVDQGPTGRLLGFGTVIIRDVGAGVQAVANVIAPLEFRRQVGCE